LQTRQRELQQTNEQLEQKASSSPSATSSRGKNQEIEQAAEPSRRSDELAQTSKYKSEFLANMSHELRTR